MALVCDWLTEIGGAEQVLLQLTRIFPEAPIYTSQYRPKTAPWFQNKDVRTGWLNIFPRKLRKFMAPLRSFYFKHLKLTGYDVVISVANAEAKGIKVSDSTLHIAYLQGPPVQYYWGMYDDYIKNPGFGKLNSLARLGLRVLIKPMRRADYGAAQRPDVLVANSHYVADEIKRFYNRDSEVIFPPVDVAKIVDFASKVTTDEISALKRELFDGEDFFIMAGRQVNWKRFDLAVDACGKAGENLLIVGDGAEHERLLTLAQDYPNIKFLPKYDGVGEIAKYFCAARGMIFTSLEPFGIVAVEALACGLPLIAFNGGGALDIVEEGVNGIFFDKQTVASLDEAIKKFKLSKFNKEVVAGLARQFSEGTFKEAWLDIVDRNFEVRQ